MTGKDQLQPAMQVVGFHVEGASPSPAAHPSLLQGVAGSPTPVIIPPAFQREPSVGPRAGSSDVTAARTGDATTSAAGAAAPSASARPIPPSVPLEGGPNSRGVSSSAPRPIQQPDKAEASHAGLIKTASQHSMTSETSPMSSASGMFSLDASTTRPTPPRPSPHGTPRQASHAPPAPRAHAAGPSGGGGDGDDDKPRALKPQKEMTKAERRALQESQRAAKAAQKGGAAPPSAADSKPRGAPSPAPLQAQHSDGAQSAKGGKSQAGAPDSQRGSAAGKQAGAAGVRQDADRRVDSAGGAPAAGAGSAPGGAGGSGGGPAAAKKKDPKAVSLNSTELFAHLQQFKRISVSSLVLAQGAAGIHPAILQLGLRYADGSIRGANARCLAMLNAFCQVIRDYTTPPGKELSRDLLRQINDQVNFLVVCRPLSVSMGNAIRFLKLYISHIKREQTDAEAKQELEEEIANYIKTRIAYASNRIAELARGKVEPTGDVILTYASSYVVQHALIQAYKLDGKRFRVVVMDARPELEGRITLQKLLAAGIPCSYVQLNAASYIIREVTKVFLGAAAVLSNGTVLSRAGAAAVAMVAHAHNKPVMICCELHKFNERVQLDSITHNELGDAEVLASVPGRPEIKALQGWNESPRLRLLNLKYDVMPAEYVTMIVSEYGMLPATSVPAILREYNALEKHLAGEY